MYYMVMYKIGYSPDLMLHGEELMDHLGGMEDGMTYAGDSSLPAVFEDRVDAVKHMNELENLYPDTTYFIQHFTPVAATPRPTL